MGVLAAGADTAGVDGVVTVGGVVFEVVAGGVGVVGTGELPAVVDAAAVVTEPSACVLMSFADAMLPAGSTEYCAVPVLPPQAARMNDALATAVSDPKPIVLLLRETELIKIFSIS